MYQQVILAFLIAILSLLILRGYDKFYNKQYTRKDYINQFFLVLISSITVLYVDNHFSNYNTTQAQSIKELNLSPKQSGGEFQSGGGSFKQFHQSSKPSSVIETNLEKIKMNFDTGVPNF
jgi:TM2 domain-containing membrane protein YozV